MASKLSAKKRPKCLLRQMSVFAAHRNNIVTVTAATRFLLRQNRNANKLWDLRDIGLVTLPPLTERRSRLLRGRNVTFPFLRGRLLRLRLPEIAQRQSMTLEEHVAHRQQSRRNLLIAHAFHTPRRHAHCRNIGPYLHLGTEVRATLRLGPRSLKVESGPVFITHAKPSKSIRAQSCKLGGDDTSWGLSRW
jgi:hypothetical protein